MAIQEKIAIKSTAKGNPNEFSTNGAYANGIYTNGIYTNDPTHQQERLHLNGVLENGALDTTLQFVSESVYWEEYYSDPDVSYEWNNGYLEEKPLTDYAKYQNYMWFVDLLRDYVYVHHNARLIGLEVGFRMVLTKKVVIRKPDLGIVLNSNPIPLGDHDRRYHGLFDVCIESLSDSNKKEIERDTVTKKLEYAQAGVREYYILDERKTETQFYFLAPGGIYLPLPRIRGVIHSQALPGFQFRLRDLYRKPTPPEMLNDPVYKGFVSPFLRAERQRAEMAERRAKRAEVKVVQAETKVAQAQTKTMQAETKASQAETRASQAETRALQAESQALQYAALLRSAGLLPTE